MLPRIDFVAEPIRCPRCHGWLSVYKSKTRTVVTLAQGTFEARDVHKRCTDTASCPVVRSRTLSRLVKPRQRYGYDLIVAVGIARYLKGKQREEIRSWLAKEHHISLSAGTVTNLCDRFLTHLQALHLARSPALRAVLHKDGYPLHLDATCARGRGGLFICMAGWRGWVLCSEKIPSEHEKYLRPLVDTTVALFGDPLAVVRDFGIGVTNAVAHLRARGIRDFGCHYHFLRVVGTKLFDAPYAALRSHLKRYRLGPELYSIRRELRRYGTAERFKGRFGVGKVREDLLVLIHWLLHGDGSKDLPYPFSLPELELWRRCRQAKERAALWVPKPRSVPENTVLFNLGRLLSRLLRPGSPSAIAADQLDEKWKAFCELREVMRLTEAELPGGDHRVRQGELPALQAERHHQIEQATEDYVAQLRKRLMHHPSPKPLQTAEAIILGYFERHGDHLFGHPVRFDESGTVTAVVDRTNNLPEHFFGSHNRRLRRRVGRAYLARDLEDQPAQVALVANLRHPDYVRILCGSLEELPAAFAELDQQALRHATPLVRTNRDAPLQARVRLLLDSSKENWRAPPRHAIALT